MREKTEFEFELDFLAVEEAHFRPLPSRAPRSRRESPTLSSERRHCGPHLSRDQTARVRP